MIIAGNCFARTRITPGTIESWFDRLTETVGVITRRQIIGNTRHDDDDRRLI